MQRDEFTALCSARAKLVRVEYGLNQERMAHIIGISKKTLVEVEKERRSLGWSESVALCTLFGESEVLAAAFGGKTADIMLSLAFDGEDLSRPVARGGRVWWTDIFDDGTHRIQQNVVSQHYRLLDSDGHRVASSFRLEDMKALIGRSQDSAGAPSSTGDVTKEAV